MTAAVLRCIIAILYIKQIETVDLKERLMAISITEASELKKAILDNFGVTLHFHDGCGGQYFTLDERNDEIKRFIVGCITVYCGEVRLIDNIAYRR